MKKACGYIRVSTDMQTELSPDAQIRLLQEYCERKDIELTKIYKDLGISGRKATKRPAFQEMISTCKKKDHPFDAIVVWKFSRFARNQEESIVFKSMLKKNNVDVISASEDLPDNEFSGLIERIIEWMDEYYSIRLSGEVIRGMTQKALEGGYQSTPPFGYDKLPKQIPTVNEERAKVVHKIFDMFCENKPASDIAMTLNEYGYRTKTGKKWEARLIWYMIENPFYIGKIRWNNYDINRRQKKTNRELIIVDGKHEPIISEEQFKKANEILKLKRETNPQKGQRGAKAVKHWLSGTLRCSVCGGTLAYSKGYDKRRGAATPFFSCWKHGKGLCPTMSYVRAIKMEQMVFDFLRSYMSMETDIDYIILPKKSTKESNIDALNHELKKIDEKERRIKMAYMDGIDTIEEYKINKGIIAKQRSEIILKLKSERSVNKDMPKHDKKAALETAEQIISMLKNESVPMETKANTIRHFINAIYYDKDTDKIKVELTENPQTLNS